MRKAVGRFGLILMLFIIMTLALLLVDSVYTIGQTGMDIINAMFGFGGLLYLVYGD